MVGEDQRGTEAFKSVEEGILGINPLEGEFKAAVFKSMLDESGIALVIFNHQNAQLLFYKPGCPVKPITKRCDPLIG